MWDVKACRGCLSVKGKLEKIGDAAKRVYSALTDIPIKDCDGYPNYFCLECRTQIKKCLAFRRKTRRAHFVLKEIMTVRKQVTYSDIITVNRKKTNLESSLNFWDPQKSGYVVINPEDPEITTEEPTQTYNTRVVEVKPLIETVEAAIKQDPPEDPSEEPSVIDDMPDADLDTAEPEPEDFPVPEDIDLTDVFKDLNDEDKSDTETVVNEVVKKNSDKDEDLLASAISAHSRKTILNALELYTIKVLDLEQQKASMALRMSQPAFALALYKCSMCLTIYESMEKLVEHVNYHNERRQGEECQVCKNKYTSVEQMNIHIAQCHMYEYQCKCGVSVFSLFDAVKHSKSKHVLHSKHYTDESAPVAEALRNFSLTSLTPKMVTEVLGLRAQSTTDTEQLKNWNGIAKAKCDICGIWLTGVTYLEKHIAYRHKYLYTCNVCKEVFTTRAQAIVHAPTHKENHIICEHCGIRAKDPKKLKKHVCHSQQRTVCNLCGMSYKNRFLHFRHQLIKHKYISLNDPLVGDPEHTCATCHVQFVDKKSYERHVVTSGHDGANDVPFACVPCKKLFDNEEQMETHFVTCGRNKKYPRKCCYCEEVLKDHLHYKQHYFNEHPNLQYRYLNLNCICELCGKLVQKYQLEAHLTAHARAAYTCRHCGHASGAAAAHVTHALAAHAARPHRCALCPRRFQHRSDCKDHILKVHAPVKLFKCEFCDQEFSYFKHLKDHSKTQHHLEIPMVKTNVRKSQTKIFVYAHMYIEINIKEKEAVEKSEIMMLDYLDQKTKTVDYKDFFKFIEDPDEYIVRIHKRLRQKKKPKSKIKIESDVVIQSSETEEAVNGIKRELRVKQEPVMEIEISLKNEAAEMEVAAVEELDDGDQKEEAPEMASEAMDEGQPLEVFENEDGQYVMIGGELYRIAGDDEE